MPRENETFRLINNLGTGGFAQTWRAQVLDNYLAEKWGANEVAIKIPLSRKYEIALINEIQLNGALYTKFLENECKNIVKFLSFDKFDGWIVMVMKYIEGGSLRDLMGRSGKSRVIKPDRAITIIQGILEGLSVIHKNYIIHRDIKPENILMDKDVPKISDLGIGRILRPNEMASTTAGTIFYMAPETLHAKYEGIHASFNADIWSLGVTFYEMLYGRYPFGIDERMQIGDIVRNLVDKTVILGFPEDVALPQKLKDIISKSLLRNPLERYGTAEDMLRDLNNLANGDEEEIEKAISSIQQLYYDVGQIENIENKFRELLLKYPSSSRLYLNMGEFYNRCGSYEKAIDAFKRGIEIDEGSAILYWGMAIAYQKKRDNSSAIKALKNALDCGLDPGLERYARLLIKTLENTS